MVGLKHRLFNLLAGVSLLLCIGWIALWLTHLLPRRGWGFWEFPYRQGGSYFAIRPDRYGLDFVWISPPQNPPPGSRFMNWAGFHIQWFQASVGFMRVLVVPSWFALPLLALLPSIWVYLRLRSQPRDGCCRLCGYDLRATLERCPECGTMLAKEQVTAK